MIDSAGTCVLCSGTGLRDEDTLCVTCKGSGGIAQGSKKTVRESSSNVSKGD